jgi:Membrane-bound toxin component of toxin-antitoxin system
LLSENHNSFLLEPATSRFFTVTIIIVHALAIIASVVNALPLTLKLALNIAVCFSLIIMLRQYYFTAQNFRLRYSAGKGWQFAREKNFYPIEILPTTVITCFVTILHFKGQDGEKWAILIFSDAVTAENYRKLKVQLKITEHS